MFDPFICILRSILFKSIMAKSGKVCNAAAKPIGRVVKGGVGNNTGAVDKARDVSRSGEHPPKSNRPNSKYASNELRIARNKRRNEKKKVKRAATLLAKRVPVIDHGTLLLSGTVSLAPPRALTNLPLDPIVVATGSVLLDSERVSSQAQSFNRLAEDFAQIQTRNTELYRHNNALSLRCSDLEAELARVCASRDADVEQARITFRNSEAECRRRTTKSFIHHQAEVLGMKKCISANADVIKELHLCRAFGEAAVENSTEIQLKLDACEQARSLLESENTRLRALCVGAGNVPTPSEETFLVGESDAVTEGVGVLESAHPEAGAKPTLTSPLPICNPAVVDGDIPNPPTPTQMETDESDPKPSVLDLAQRCY